MNYIYEFMIFSHPANSPFFRYLTNLPPFALWTVFLSALVGRYAHDYYEGSVTVCLSTLRRGALWARDTVRDERYQAILGIPLTPLVSLLERWCLIGSSLRDSMSIPFVNEIWVRVPLGRGFPIGQWLDLWRLEFKQCSLYHDSQSLRGAPWARLEGVYLRPKGASAPLGCPLGALYLDALFTLWFPITAANQVRLEGVM